MNQGLVEPHASAHMADQQSGTQFRNFLSTPRLETWEKYQERSNQWTHC